VADRPPPYELFFAPLEIALSPNKLERVRFAYIVSKYGHAGQEREDGTRYFDHPKAATWIFIEELAGRDARVIVDILLHDLSEDAYLLSMHRISMNFGSDIALDLRSLTKLPKGKETTDQYLGRIIAQGPWAIVAKLCDRLHNLRTLDSCSEEKRRGQIEETQQYHLRLLVPALKRHGEPWNGYADALEVKIRDAINAVPRES
jgi:guanosine-3',5'-bis(diphosphate) 3'-pyrophosphohydrolase